jgi:hypothetical protein
LLPWCIGDDWAICVDKDELDYCISYDGGDGVLGNEIHIAKTEAQARCAALIWLIENNHISTNDVAL